MDTSHSLNRSLSTRRRVVVIAVVDVDDRGPCICLVVAAAVFVIYTSFLLSLRSNARFSPRVLHERDGCPHDKIVI